MKAYLITNIVFGVLAVVCNLVVAGLKADQGKSCFAEAWSIASVSAMTAWAAYLLATS